MHVIVLGGNGYLGPWIIERLKASAHDVTIFHRKAATPDIAGDRNHLEESAETFRSLQPDVVVDALAFTESQAQSLVRVFQGVARRLVVLSSGDVYRANDILFGRVPGAVDSTPLTESAPLRERLFPYRGISIPPLYGFNWDDYDKILVERIVLANADLPATVLRLPMVYGPGDREGTKRRFFAYQKRMQDGRPAILLDRRTARWRAPWGYVENIAEAVRLAVEDERAAGEIYNVCDPAAHDTEHWVRDLAAAAHWKGEIVISEEPGPPPNLPPNLNLAQHLHMDTTKIRAELGFRETASRAQALERTVAWDREHRPEKLDLAQFDYAAEDAILARTAGATG